MATFEVISAAAIGGGGGGSSYLVLTGFLTQSGTDAPVITVLGDNTLGFTPTTTYEATGEWTIVSPTGWDADKTWFLFQSPASYGEVSGAMVGAQIINDDPFINVIYLNIRNVSGGGSNLPTDFKMPFEIRVYP